MEILYILGIILCYLAFVLFFALTILSEYPFVPLSHKAHILL
jgi:hypothetical protein